jgi:HD-like signal output (HDOD) protein
MSAPVSDDEIAAAVACLPPVSAVMQRILTILGDPDAQLEDIARLVRAETALAAQVLRMANSAYFGLPTPAATIDEAIQRLGIAEINRLVTMLSSRQLFLQPLKAHGISADELWEHTLVVAVCAETLALYAESDRNAAHLAGVLHPVGMLALEHVARSRRTPPRPAHELILPWERACFGTDNAAVAAHVLRQWGFPESLAAVVAGRYEIPDQASAARAGASLLHLASLLAEKMGGALAGERGQFRMSPEKLSAAAIPWDAQNLERTRALLRISG